ncbi:hypothetical protein [Dickeya zeae]|uniref:hypothetical protein n=1 Tax=Dickeya zeae TaxID=204042 RepID=UPI0003A10F1E|nr:hypothetical protein [Dickeya zeae]
MIELNGTQLKKMSGATNRYAFDKKITDGMPVGYGQARCHTISYDTIANAIVDTINEIKQPTVNRMLDGLLLAIFPLANPNNHIYTGIWSNNLELAKAAYENYTAAQVALAAIKALLSSQPVDLQKVKQHANELLKALNNSPDNLRLGYQTTNASIGNAVDIDTKWIMPNTQLQNVKIHYMENNTWKWEIVKNLTCTYISGIAGYQLGRLLSDTYSCKGISLYSNGNTLQTSNNQGQTSGVMGSLQQVVPIVVSSIYTANEYVIFQRF